ncbi:MAG: fold [Actinomycetota bacterium]|jgi:PAS domain S-box-containing protein
MRESDGRCLGADGTDELRPHDIASAAEGILFVEDAPLPLFVAVPDGRVALANRALRELLGYQGGDLIGQRVAELFADPTAAAFWSDLLVAGGAAERAMELRRRDGTSIAARSAAVVVTGRDGVARWVIGRVQPI